MLLQLKTPLSTISIASRSLENQEILSNPEKVVETARRNDYELIIIADHGNADHALNEDGSPNTAHSLNPVPFVYVSKNKSAIVENGILADVAPSICHILGIQQPADMSGRNLIK